MPVKISLLPDAGSVAGNIQIPVVEDGITKRSTPTAMLTGLADGSTLEVSGNTLHVKDAGITAAKLADTLKELTINFIIDGGGAEITTGIKMDVQVDFACTILSATLLADQAGDIVIDIWKDSYANYPPDDADSITASAPPTISSDTKSTDATLTGWTTSISAGDILRINVDSVTTIERVTLALKVRRT